MNSNDAGEDFTLVTTKAKKKRNRHRNGLAVASPPPDPVESVNRTMAELRSIPGWLESSTSCVSISHSVLQVILGERLMVFDWHAY